MDSTAHVPVTGSRYRLLQAYSAAGQRGPAHLANLLPAKDDADYLWVLAELIRLDLEQSRLAGQPYTLSDYRQIYPELFENPVLLRQLAREDFQQLHQQYGDQISLEDYSKAVGLSASSVLMTGLNEPMANVTVGTCTEIVLPEVVDGMYRTSVVTIDPLRPEAHVMADPEVNNCKPSSVSNPSQNPGLSLRSRFPVVDEVFLGFRLIAELGTGAFARVFLAEQIDLANRLVALKVTTRPTREPQRLAKLRHTNIVPIYSVHDDARPLQAVCMPFLGRQTLADLLKAYRSTGIFPHTSGSVASTAILAQRSTVKSSQAHTVPNSSSQLPALSGPGVDPAWPEREKLIGNRHVDLVLWLLSRMAEGLAHAHDKGILHLDLKPGNVLFADDGEPLLLDFNLSFDRNSAERERAGGTLPYMAPEQLEDYRDQESGPPRVDERTDLFALGVMAFELLTGDLPFPMPTDRAVNLTKLANARRKGAPALSPYNQEISPAVESIVLKLLEPDPDARYQSAHELLVDLNRQRDHLPLKHAANRSLKERFAKWRKRNPRLTLYICLGLAMVSAGTFWYAAHRREQALLRSEAVVQTRLIHDALVRLRLDLTTRDEPQSRKIGYGQATALLAQFGLPGNPTGYRSHPMYHVMDDQEQKSFRAAVGELSLLLAHSFWLDELKNPAGQRHEGAAKGLVWNEIAQHCFDDGDNRPKVLQRQREILSAERDGMILDLKTQICDQLDQPVDLYLCGVELMARNQFADAMVLLEKLTLQTSGHYAGHYCLAICQQQLGSFASSLTNYKVAQALSTKDPRPAFNRGMLYLLMKEYGQAESDFSEAIGRDPSFSSAIYHRAICRSRTNRPMEAMRDLDLALTRGFSPLQVSLFRSSLYVSLKDREKAEAALKETDQMQPRDAQDYLVRGTSRISRNPTGALEDLSKAAELNPLYFVPWQNMASVLGDKLNQPQKALEAQDKAVELVPDFASARIGRAVLLARLGRRAEAHEEAENALLMSSESAILYQACCVYAVTARKHPEDTPRALGLLRQALSQGYRDFNSIANDPDLEELRHHRDFKSTVRAAKELVK